MDRYKSALETCSGPSMCPVLKGGDGLILEKYKTDSEIKIGDIIVYPHPEDYCQVVHRVIGLSENGVTTRGDNNAKKDPYIVRYGCIKGKVKAVNRKGRVSCVANGIMGYYIHRLITGRVYIKLVFMKHLRFISKTVAKSRLLYFLNPLFPKKVIKVKRNEIEEEILLCGNRAVGKRTVGKKDWRIKFPYKLFINPDFAITKSVLVENGEKPA